MLDEDQPQSAWGDLEERWKSNRDDSYALFVKYRQDYNELVVQYTPGKSSKDIALARDKCIELKKSYERFDDALTGEKIRKWMDKADLSDKKWVDFFNQIREKLQIIFENSDLERQKRIESLIKKLSE